MKYVVSILKYIVLANLIFNLLFCVCCLYQQDWIRVITGFTNEVLLFFNSYVYNGVAEMEWS